MAEKGSDDEFTESFELSVLYTVQVRKGLLRALVEELANEDQVANELASFLRTPDVNIVDGEAELWDGLPDDLGT